MNKIKKGAVAALRLLPSVPFFILSGCFLVLPFISMLKESFTDPDTGAFTFGNYVRCFTKPAYSFSVLNSVNLAVLATTISMVVAFFVALALFTLGAGTKKWFMPILNMAQNFAGFPLAFSFILMFGSQGFVLLVLRRLDLHFLDDYNLYTVWGIFPMFVWFGIPLATLLLLPGFDAIRKEWQEASALLGCGRIGFWLRIGIPNLAPSIFGTTSIVFADSITTYTTTYMILSTNGLLLPIKIFSMFSGDIKTQTELGSALSVVMILIILLVMGLCNIGKAISVRKGVSAQ